MALSRPNFHPRMSRTEASSKSCTVFWRATTSAQRPTRSCRTSGSKLTTSRLRRSAADHWERWASTGSAGNTLCPAPFGMEKRHRTALKKSLVTLSENGISQIHTRRPGRNETWQRARDSPRLRSATGSKTAGRETVPQRRKKGKKSFPL